VETLNLPAYDLRTRTHEEREEVYDPVRDKYVRLTPEEWVRQHFVQYLVQEQGVPAGLLAVEPSFKAPSGLPRRADIVAYDRQGQPLLLVECKAPRVAIQQAVFDQVAAYNTVVQARYFVVTNGQDHYCCVWDGDAEGYRFLTDFPPYEDLLRTKN
jgi:hypothetical protein